MSSPEGARKEAPDAFDVLKVTPSQGQAGAPEGQPPADEEPAVVYGQGLDDAEEFEAMRRADEEDLREAEAAAAADEVGDDGYGGAYGGEEYGDDGEGDEDDEEDDWMDPNNPLLERVQVALKEQLTRSDAAVTLTLRERDEAVARAKKEREDLGVKLYSMQQQLAKLQMGLERTHTDYTSAKEERLRTEEELKAMAGEVEEREAAHQKALSERQEAQKELDRLLDTVRHIAEYNKDLASDIVVTRRAAYGTEEQMKKVEKDKRRQDLQIDRMEGDVRRVEGELELLDSQIEAQRDAAAGASAMVKDAAGEMEQIAAEKSEYYDRWRASVVGMARRDAVLEEAEKAIVEQRERCASLETEIRAYRESATKAQKENEELTARLQRVENEGRFLEERIETVRETRRRLAEQYQALKSSLEAVDREVSRARVEKRRLESEVGGLRRKRERLVMRRKELQDRVLEHVGQQTTIEKGAQNVYTKTVALRDKIRGRENEKADLENELARIRVDKLNTEAHSTELQRTLEEFERELKEKDRLIERYEQEIRQRHDAIEKKQIYIVRLNRKYETLTSGVEEENTGPLEATINHLSKEISAKERDSAELQRHWLKSQTELLGVVSDIDQRQGKLDELQGKRTVIEQRRIRVRSRFKHFEDETRELERGILSMHSSFSRLNELIAKNKSLEKELADDTYNMENEFKEKLRELEAEGESIRARVRDVTAEKERVFGEIVELERQILLWEKKIQLERETQEALNPEHGQPEIRGMKKEIHRMELRLAQLQREQERMITEMERTIGKQESIKMSQEATKTKEHLTKATLKKQVVNTRMSLKQTSRECRRVEGEVRRQEEENAGLLQRLDAAQEEYTAVEREVLKVSRDVERTDLENRLRREGLRLAQQKSRRYQETVEGRYRVTSTRGALVDRLVKQETRLTKIKGALQAVSEQHPEHAEIFRALADFASG